MPQPKDKDWLNGLRKQDPYICCLPETHLKTRDTYRLKVKGWKKIFHANRYQKKAGVAILISDKIDFKTKAVKRDKEGPCLELLNGNAYAVQYQLKSVECSIQNTLRKCQSKCLIFLMNTF